MGENLLKSFEEFLPGFIEAMKARNDDFLKKVYPEKYFKIIDEKLSYNLDMMDPGWIVELAENPKTTKSCTGDKCKLTNAEKGEVVFTFIENQWIGFDVEEMNKMMELRKQMAEFKYDYQISFAAFGPLKLEFMLNGKPVEQLANYQNEHTVSFVPFGLMKGENSFLVKANIDSANPQYEQKLKGDKVEATLSYEIFRFPKNNTDSNALFDKNNILIKSGDPNKDLAMEELLIGKEGLSREVKFVVE